MLHYLRTRETVEHPNHCAAVESGLVKHNRIDAATTPVHRALVREELLRSRTTVLHCALRNEEGAARPAMELIRCLDRMPRKTTRALHDR